MRFPTGVSRDRFNLITAVLAKHARLKVRASSPHILHVPFMGHDYIMEYDGTASSMQSPNIMLHYVVVVCVCVCSSREPKG